MNNQKKLFFTLIHLLISVSLAACSSMDSGGFGSTGPQSDLSTAAASRTNSVGNRSGQSGVVSPRAMADMQALSRQQGQGVYRIGPSDLLEIKVFQADELSRQVRVDQRGSITLPLMGSIRVAGLSQIELEKRLADLLGRDLLRNPQVSVFIKEFTAQRVTVEGEVKKQGVYPISGDVTILQAIAMAGGLEEFASAEDVVLFRKQSGATRTYTIDVNAIRNGQAADPLLRNDDRIVVARGEEKRITVDGEVRRPGVYPYKERITVLQAVALAQGLSNLAEPHRVALFRRENGQEKVYSVNLAEIRQGIAPDPFIQSNDRIMVHRSNSRYWLKEAATFFSPLNALSAIIAR